MLKYSWFSKILSNNLISMHCTSITTFLSTHNIGKPRIRINKSRFYLLGDVRFHTMPMHNMGNLKASNAYFSNPPQLVADFVRLITQFVANMGI